MYLYNKAICSFIDIFLIKCTYLLTLIMFTCIYTLNNLLLLDAFIKMHSDIRFI